MTLAMSIVPVDRALILITDKDLPDQVKGYLKEKNTKVLDKIAFADLRMAEIYLVDTDGFVWKFKYDEKSRRKWQYYSTNSEEGIYWRKVANVLEC